LKEEQPRQRILEIALHIASITLGLPNVRLSNPSPVKEVGDTKGVITLEVKQGMRVRDSDRNQLRVATSLIADTVDPNSPYLPRFISQDTLRKVILHPNPVNHAPNRFSVVAQVVNSISVSGQGDIHKEARIPRAPRLHNSDERPFPDEFPPCISDKSRGCPMKRLVSDKVWNRISIEIPDVKSVSIGLPPAEAVPTNAKQITADIPVVPKNDEKLIELGVKIPLFVFVFVAVYPNKTRRARCHRKVDREVVFGRRSSGEIRLGRVFKFAAQKFVGSPVGLLTFQGAVRSRAARRTEPRIRHPTDCT
jgi:hypothetical protein